MRAFSVGIILFLVLAKDTAAAGQRVVVTMCSEKYELSFDTPAGCSWDGSEWLMCEAGSFYLGCYNPPRNARYAKFSDRFDDEVRRTRRAFGERPVKVRALRVNALEAGEIRYTGVNETRVIELLIGVPEDSSGGILFDVVTEATSRKLQPLSLKTYRKLLATFHARLKNASLASPNSLISGQLAGAASCRD